MNNIDFLNTIVEELLRESNIDSLLEKAIGRFTKILEAERVTFYFYNEDARELWSYAVTDLEISEIRIPIGQGIAGMVARKKKILNIRDAYTYSFFNKKIDRQTGYRTKSVLCAPLLSRDKTLLGVVQAINKKGKGWFTDFDLGIMKSLSLYLAIALENVRLLQDHETLFRSTLYALVGAVDAKDPVTAGHSYRVAYFAVKIGKALGFSPSELKILEYSAYLHDVGKIGIPEAILTKNSRLTERELSVIQKHPIYTLQILNNIIFSKDTKVIPLAASSHHEFLDGTGYPLGLREDKISIFSRIITVADIFDALTAFDRPYKKHMKIKDALAILKSETQKHHLDKKIVNLFFRKALYKYEQRRYVRLDLHTSVTYRIISQKRILAEGIKDERKLGNQDLGLFSNSSVDSINISSGGLLFLAKPYIPVGTFLDLDVEILSKKIKCLGKVVRIERVTDSENYRVGVSFINMASRARAVFSVQLAKLLAKRKK